MTNTRHEITMETYSDMAERERATDEMRLDGWCPVHVSSLDEGRYGVLYVRHALPVPERLDYDEVTLTEILQ